MSNTHSSSLSLNHSYYFLLGSLLTRSLLIASSSRDSTCLNWHLQWLAIFPSYNTIKTVDLKKIKINIEVGAIYDAIVHRRSLTDITMLSRHLDHQTPPRIILSFAIISLGNYTVYTLQGFREPLLICRALKPLLNECSCSAFSFEICDHTDSTEQQYHTFKRLDLCQWCSVSANHSSYL